MNIQRSYKDDRIVSPSTLYLVPTPIGNMQDMTFRAISILKEVDLILAEDTRRTGILLKHFEIENTLQSYHEHTTEARISELVSLLEEGSSIALVSDAGMPVINDPGHPLIRECLDKGVSVISLPGANAALTALIASGLPADSFTYYGFFPRKNSERVKLLEEVKEQEKTAIFYESPNRLLKALDIVFEVLGEDSKVVVARELTKVYEEYVRGNVGEVREHFKKTPPKGEIVLLVHPTEEKTSNNLTKDEIVSLINDIIEETSCKPNSAIKEVSKKYKLNRNYVYQVYHNL